MPAYSRRVMPNNGSGKVLSLTRAATTVVGTVASCHPLGENCGVDITSPLASTLADVCSVQPSCSINLSDDFSWAKREEARRNWTRTTVTTSHRLPEFMTLLSIAVMRNRDITSINSFQ